MRLVITVCGLRDSPPGIRPGMAGHFLLLAQKKVTKEEELSISDFTEDCQRGPVFREPSGAPDPRGLIPSLGDPLRHVAALPASWRDATGLVNAPSSGVA